VTTRTDRTLWYVDPTMMANDSEEERAPMEPASGEAANLTSSLLTSGLHSPILDLDFPARLVPSSTEGHFHLYLDGLEIDWDRYEPLLKALADAGVIGQGYAHFAIERRQTILRREGVTKKGGKPVEVPASGSWQDDPEEPF
jgi:hypothetical protein